MKLSPWEANRRSAGRNILQLSVDPRTCHSQCRAAALIRIFVQPKKTSALFLIISSATVRFQVLKVTSMKVAILWDVTPCGQVEIDWRFWGTYCLHHQVDCNGATSQKAAIFSCANLQARGSTHAIRSQMGSIKKRGHLERSGSMLLKWFLEK
jgi:hypothetical protein